MTTRLLIGTTKGAFVLSSEDRVSWALSGPHCQLWPINHVVGDAESDALWAGGGNDWYGAGVWRSDDGGETWSLTKLTSGSMDEWAANDADFAAMIGWEPSVPFGDAFPAVWSLHAAHGALWAGTKNANLLRSMNGGVTFEQVDGMTNHESREGWNPGAAGLILHTLISHPSDPSKMWAGVSAAGVFATEDGGATWERRNRLSNAADCGHHHHPAAPRDGETGHCVHNALRAPGDADLIYQQNHHGVWKSRDGGRSWEDITAGLPSTFGFPIRVHPRDPETIWTIPLNGDMAGRYPPDAAAAVWRSRNGGETWEAMRDGLPQDGCFFTVLRQAMAGDTGEQAGVYFGTNSGSIFASIDEGETWSEIAAHLPTVLSVEVHETA